MPQPPGPSYAADDDFDPVADLVDVLDLDRLPDASITIEGSDGEPETELGSSSAAVFVGRSQPMPHGRVFGGQVLAQSVIAAGRTVADVDDGARRIHSLHGYFIRPGDAGHPIRFAVERLMDGNSFSTRRVHAIQYGKVILSMITSFQRSSPGLDHQVPMPDAPEPESRPSATSVLRGLDNPIAEMIARRRPIDVRHNDETIFLEPQIGGPLEQSVWLRAISPLPDDPLLHSAILAYVSDYSLLEPAMRRHGLTWSDSRLRMASLDHAMWFHRPARVDEWILYAQSSPSAQSGRALGTGEMFSRDGTLVASVAQEGMVRVKDV